MGWGWGACPLGAPSASYAYALLFVVLHIRSREDNTTLQDIVLLLSLGVVKSLPRHATEVWKSWI